MIGRALVLLVLAASESTAALVEDLRALGRARRLRDHRPDPTGIEGE